MKYVVLCVAWPFHLFSEDISLEPYRNRKICPHRSSNSFKLTKLKLLIEYASRKLVLCVVNKYAY